MCNTRSLRPSADPQLLTKDDDDFYRVLNHFPCQRSMIAACWHDLVQSLTETLCYDVDIYDVCLFDCWTCFCGQIMHLFLSAILHFEKCYISTSGMLHRGMMQHHAKFCHDILNGSQDMMIYWIRYGGFLLEEVFVLLSSFGDSVDDATKFCANISNRWWDTVS